MKKEIKKLMDLAVKCNAASVNASESEVVVAFHYDDAQEVIYDEYREEDVPVIRTSAAVNVDIDNREVRVTLTESSSHNFVNFAESLDDVYEFVRILIEDHDFEL